MKELMKASNSSSAMWRVYVGECAGSRSVSRPQKRWIDTVKECLRKKKFGCRASKENGPG